MDNLFHRNPQMTVFSLTALLFALSAFDNSESPKSYGSDEGVITFKKDVLPLIRKNCISCHSVDSDRPAGLSMDTYEDLIAGGEHGPSVVAGSPEKSLLYLKILPRPPFGKSMPPLRRRMLSISDIETVRKWIAQGAHRQ